jgi:single-stranded DNA-binding protein
MANNGTQVSDLVLTVTKVPELKVSGKGNKFLKFGAVHEDNGEKTWFSVVAFKTVAIGLNSVVKKGSKIKATGVVSQKEYEKKDGSGVGIENNLIINSAKVATDNGVVTVDDFFEPKADPF